MNTSFNIQKLAEQNIAHAYLTASINQLSLKRSRDLILANQHPVTRGSST